MQQCDILIVGGGPAGSTVARQLTRAGIDVLLIDKRTFPRDKVCAGWVTPAVIQSLAIDPDDYRKGRIFQSITGFRVGVIGGDAVDIAYDQPVSFGIRRCEFDHYLLERSGAPMRLGEQVKSMQPRDGRWIVNDEIECNLLIGAGGHFCPVARHLNRDGGEQELIVAAQEVEFPLSAGQRDNCAIDARVPELYFCPDLSGYAWCFRKGDYLNIGLGREDQHKLSDHVAAFVDWLKQIGRIPPDVPDRFHGHAYILYGHTKRKLVDDGVMLIGDSAGLAYPQSGEGIRAAVESAIMASQTILAVRGPYTRGRLASYTRRLKERFGDPDAAAGAGLDVLPESWKQSLAGKLLRTHWFARHIVLDRWFLHHHQPALVAV